MNIILLAAGQGARLRPYTDNKPKCMVELAGKPLLHHQMDTIAKFGVINKTTIVGGYRVDDLDAQGADIVVNPRYDRTNMVYTLFCARDHMKPGEDLLISYGDIIYEPRVLQAVLECESDICLAADKEWKRLWQLRMDNPLSDAETFIMNDKGMVTELGKVPDSYEQVMAQYMGLIKIRGDKVAEFIAAYDAMDRNKIYDGKDFENMYLTSFIQHLIDSGWAIKACLVNNGWLEVDAAEDLDLYERMVNENRLNSFIRIS